MYAGSPKIAQELFFWDIIWGSVHPTEENIFFVKNIDMYNYTVMITQIVFENFKFNNSRRPNFYCLFFVSVTMKFQNELNAWIPVKVLHIYFLINVVKSWITNSCYTYVSLLLQLNYYKFNSAYNCIGIKVSKHSEQCMLLYLFI